MVLMAATILALVVANTGLDSVYRGFLDLPVMLQVGAVIIDKPLLLWINDGLMAIFFLLVGLELKREVLYGELTDLRKVALPAFGAVGGMLVPALVYVSLNWNNPLAIQGWAIPAATDIAFALGVLSLLGSRVPVSLKVFLVSLAIFDDVGAILIIAVFYSSELSTEAMMAAVPCVVLLGILNRARVRTTWPYVVIGGLLWLAVLKSGVHATLAGVLLALFIPARAPNNEQQSLLKRWESGLHMPVAFLILPLFAFANAGLPLGGLGLDDLMHPVSLGIALGLFLGKQLGVFSFCAVAVALGLARLPKGVRWSGLYGAALLSGIGFTMSLFIGSLAFESAGARAFDERVGILCGSLLSALAGAWVLSRATRAAPTAESAAT